MNKNYDAMFLMTCNYMSTVLKEINEWVPQESSKRNQISFWPLWKCSNSGLHFVSHAWRVSYCTLHCFGGKSIKLPFPHMYCTITYTCKFMVKRHNTQREIVCQARETKKSGGTTTPLHMWQQNSVKTRFPFSLGEWSKTCRYCKGRAAANLAKLV